MAELIKIAVPTTFIDKKLYWNEACGTVSYIISAKLLPNQSFTDGKFIKECLEWAVEVSCLTKKK